jgi:decaprenylphospho-beta-D-erythro-pentofuranosid-2-ulose 2-reductase
MGMQSNGSARSVVLIGATSTVARCIARECARDGYDLVLAAIEYDELEEIATDIRARSEVLCATLPFDACAPETHEQFAQDCQDALDGVPTGVILCAGYMPDQEKSQQNYEQTKATIDINFTGAASVLNAFANRFEARRSGFIAAISSCAGDRGRESNYTYGAAKAGLTAYLSGLRNRLFHSGVHVTTVKPGFMDTKMTYGMSLPKPLVASPEDAAVAIWDAIKKQKDEVYVLWFWRYIMLIIRHVPEFIFKRLHM